MRHATMPEVVVKLMEGRARVARGWCQGQLSEFRPDSLGGTMYCAIGAIGTDLNAHRALSRALIAGTNYSCLANYNDHPSRTQADILALFDRAIEGALS